MAATPRTPGEIREIVENLKALGVVRAKIGDLEVEFLPVFPAQREDPIEHMSPEDYEEKAKAIRKKLEEEVYAAS